MDEEERTHWLKEFKINWQILVIIGIILATGYGAAVATVEWWETPDIAREANRRSIENRDLFEGHREDFDQFLRRFDRFLCLRQAERSGDAFTDCERYEP